MESLSQAEVGSALQVFFNLKELPEVTPSSSCPHLLGVLGYQYKTRLMPIPIWWIHVTWLMSVAVLAWLMASQNAGLISIQHNAH